jgi:serine/threonine protein kinase
MALSKHPNVLRVYGSFVNGSKLYIVTPYLAAGSCLDIMKTAFPEGLDEISIATILRQALEGLIYLHKNGHIHRDVKAGNLLMDQQGTVLLADFGVSSSLTENGDVRKTFVGTPCWMAPEVMEQAGYDYKADIWSFGITSLELATGHAPFAKFPPMKVLMMTLSNAPPTLDREGGKHKYSKAFKDMIDSCLQKDPSKRPSAEKLLTFPFFKQAKKRDYLIKTILSNTVPLDQRPHKKVPQKHISFESTEQWDFDTLSDEEADSHPKKPETPSIISPTTTPLERSRSMVQFEDCPKPVHIDRTKSTNVSPITSDVEPIPVKKHISFGEAVIRDPPLGRTVMSPLVESPPPVTTTNTTTTTTTTTTAAAAAAAAAVAAHEPILTSTPIAQTPGSSVSFAATPPAYAPPVLHSAPLSKKSRFVIEDATPTTQQLLSAESPSSDSPISNASPAIDIESVGLGILTTPSIQNSNTIPGATTTASAGAPTVATVAANAAAVAANISNNSNTLQEGEFKKGRFSVNQTPNRATTPAVEEASYINSPYGNEKPTQLEYKPTPMSRAASQDSFQERKSRFEVKHSNTSGTNMQTPISVTSTPIEPNTPMQSLPLTRENSNTSALSRDSSMNNSKVSRFSIEKPEAAVVGPCCELPAALVSTMSPECRKKGRFELTGGSNTPSESGGSNRQDTSHMDSPQSTVAPSPAISPCSSLSRGQAHRILDSSMSHMVYSHMESLIKQTEIQKNMLHDLLVTMPLIYGTNSNNSPQSILTRSRTISDSKKPAFTHNEEVYQK